MEIENIVKPMVENEKAMNGEIRWIWDDFDKMAAWFNSLELDNNKGPLTRLVDKYNNKVESFIQSKEDFDKMFKNDFHQMKQDIGKLINRQEKQKVEMIHYNDNFHKFSAENKLLKSGFEENRDFTAKAVKEC